MHTSILYLISDFFKYFIVHRRDSFKIVLYKSVHILISTFGHSEFFIFLMIFSKHFVKYLCIPLPFSGMLLYSQMMTQNPW